MSLLDNKRFWVSLNQSYAFGHPETYKHGYKDRDIVAGSGSTIKVLDEYDDHDFYEEFFPTDSQYDNGDFFSDASQADDDVFFFGEAGEEPLIEVGETYTMAVDDEYDPTLVLE